MESLQDRRVWLGGAVVAAVLIVAASWFMFINPKLSDASNSRSQAAATRVSNTQLQARVTVLKQKSANTDQYRKSLSEALAAMPFDSGLPAFTRQLTAQAAAAHVTLEGITVGGITATGGGTASTTTPAPTATGTTGGASTGTVYAVQVSLVSDGSLVQQLVFLQEVRYYGARRALITNTSFAPGAGTNTNSIDRSSKLTTQLTVFSAPQSPAQIAQLTKLLNGTAGN